MLLHSVPGAPELTLSSTTGDSLTMSWTVPSGTVVEKYELLWSIEGSQSPVEVRNTVSGSIHSYTVPVLGYFENVTVTITVTAVNAVGSSSSLPLTVHSDVIHNGPTESTNASITVEAIIGGVVGILFVGLMIGTVTVIVVFKLIRNYRKEKKK